MSSSNNSPVLEDNIDGNTRKIWVDVSKQNFVSELHDRKLVVSKQNYTNMTTLVLSGENNGKSFLVSIDICSTDEEGEHERDFEDFFGPQERSPPKKKDKTHIIIHPYEKEKILRKKTGREYIEEAEEMVDKIVSISKKIKERSNQ